MFWAFTLLFTWNRRRRAIYFQVVFSSQLEINFQRSGSTFLDFYISFYVKPSPSSNLFPIGIFQPVVNKFSKKWVHIFGFLHFFFVKPSSSSNLFPTGIFQPVENKFSKKWVLIFGFLHFFLRETVVVVEQFISKWYFLAIWK